MPSASSSQVLCGPFNSDDLPDYQAAIQVWRTHWFRCLTDTQNEIVLAIIDSTVRFVKSSRWMTYHWFVYGGLPNPEEGFAGTAPITPITRDNFYKNMRKLIELGIVVEIRRDTYAIDYSITAAHLTADENIVRSMRSRNSRGGQLQTQEGIQEWSASRIIHSLTTSQNHPLQDNNSNTSHSAKKPSQEKPSSWPQKPSKKSPSHSQNEKECGKCCTDQPKCEQTTSTETCLETTQTENTSTTKNEVYSTNNAGIAVNWSKHLKIWANRYSVVHKTQLIISDKSNIICLVGNHSERNVMRSPQEILAAALDGSLQKREKVRVKRRVRRNVTDLVAMFELEWARGQRERDATVPPNRIVGRYRSILKKNIIYPAMDTELDTDAFAYWVAHNWQAIGATYFSNSKSYPERPVIPWLVKCFETYIIAFQQKEHLDTEGTRSQTDLMKRAAATTQMQEAGRAVAEDLARENALLKAQLRERDAIIRKQGSAFEMENDMLDDKAKRILQRGKKMVLPDYDDEPAPKRKKAKRK